MENVSKKARAEMLQPPQQRPRRTQVAALCYRGEGAKRKILLITSRGTGRWILPKGWPIDGLSASGAAMQEAWEEAGVKKGQVVANALGHFDFDKELDTGGIAACTAEVFEVKVEKLVDKYPEAAERKRIWVTAEEAADMVVEPGLQEILRAF